jgi:hypothetical protein
MPNRIRTAWTSVAKAWQRPAPETVLLPLTPRYDPDKHRVYFEALEVALTTKKAPILNIALTGSYGVGKSSILGEVARRHKRKVLPISLSTLGFADGKSGEASTSKTNRIQKEIVKQLLYSQDPVRMPGSQYRRMTRFRLWRELGMAVLFAVPVAVVFYLTGWAASIANLIPLPEDWALLVHVVIFGAAVLLIVGFRTLFHNRIQIDKITAGSATISLSPKTATYFDEYLDEIVYFFEVVRRDIVIFEDIDRFEEPHIFETLRSLNSILNTAKQLKGRRIRFIYAIKDSIFDELGARAAAEALDDAEKKASGGSREDAAVAEVARANRTKFFDLVIPVVPFITHRSARDLIIDTMKDIDHNVSNELIDLAARHVADMRLIKNVRNEFVIFKRQIIDPKTLDLDPDKLFAMILYKSTHLSDFELIKLGKSNLDDLYRDSRLLVTSNLSKLGGKIRNARAEKARARVSSTLASELGERLLDYIKIRVFDSNGYAIISYDLAGSSVDPDDFTTQEFWTKLAVAGAILTVTFRHPNSREQLQVTREEIADALDEPINTKEWAESERARLDAEIREATADREFLSHADLGGLMSRGEFAIKRAGEELSLHDLAEGHLQSNLAVQLVAAGYIDRNFTLYTSTFYGERISANATNFILKNIDANVTDMFFPLSADDVDAIIREKGRTILRERSSYNLSVLDRLLGSSQELTAILVGKLMTYAAEEREFLLAYLEDGEKQVELIEELAGRWPKTLAMLTEDAHLDDDAANQLIDVALLNLSSDLSYVMRDSLHDYLVQNYAALRAFTSDDITGAQAEQIAALVNKLGARIPDLDVLGKPVLAAVVASGDYELTRENLFVALGSPTPSLSLDGIGAADGAVLNRALEDLPRYLALLHPEEATVDDPSEFARLIDAVAEADATQLEPVIQRATSNCHVEDLTTVPPKAWWTLAAGQRFPASFANVYAYAVDQIGIEANLAGLLSSAGRITVPKGTNESEIIELATTILKASAELLSAKVRADLVSGLGLKEYLDAASVPSEPGELIGRLIEESVVADDEDTFARIPVTDINGMAYAINRSTAFPDFMSTMQIPPQNIEGIMSNTDVRASVKDAIVDRFDEFTEDAKPRALSVVAQYVLSHGKGLTYQQVARIAAEGVKAEIVLPLLQPHLSSLAATGIAGVLMSLGGEYGKITVTNGRYGLIRDTPAARAVADRLYTLNVVSSKTPKDGILRVNMRKRL